MNTSYCDVEPASGSHAPAWPVDATSDLRDLHAYWLASRGGQPMPRLGDLDLVELAATFRGLLLARAVPETSSYGFLFYPLARHATEDGKDAVGLEPSLFQHIPLDGCNLAMTRRVPVVERVSQLSSNGMPVDCEVIYLPLGPDGGRGGAAVEAILILAVETLPRDFIA